MTQQLEREHQGSSFETESQSRPLIVCEGFNRHVREAVNYFLIYLFIYPNMGVIAFLQ